MTPNPSVAKPRLCIVTRAASVCSHHYLWRPPILVPGPVVAEAAHLLAPRGRRTRATALRWPPCPTDVVAGGTGSRGLPPRARTISPVAGVAVVSPAPTRHCATLCYMNTVTHREMRNNSGEILRRVEAGESIQVTNNGRVAALIVPPSGDPLTDLAAPRSAAYPHYASPSALRNIRSANLATNLRADPRRLPGPLVTLAYLDTSAAIKLVVEEAESASLANMLASSSHRLVVVLAAAHRDALRGRTPPRGRRTRCPSARYSTPSTSSTSPRGRHDRGRHTRTAAVQRRRPSRRRHQARRRRADHLRPRIGRRRNMRRPDHPRALLNHSRRVSRTAADRPQSRTTSSPDTDWGHTS